LASENWNLGVSLALQACHKAVGAALCFHVRRVAFDHPGSRGDYPFLAKYRPLVFLKLAFIRHNAQRLAFEVTHMAQVPDDLNSPF
ncbi:MAG: hypothetical protein AAF497_00605, partial [Planctomycetota bacterium]